MSCPVFSALFPPAWLRLIFPVTTGAVNRIVVHKIKIPIAAAGVAEGREAAAAAAAVAVVAAAADQEREVVLIF